MANDGFEASLNRALELIHSFTRQFNEFILGDVLSPATIEAMRQLDPAVLREIQSVLMEQRRTIDQLKHRVSILRRRLSIYQRKVYHG